MNCSKRTRWTFRGVSLTILLLCLTTIVTCEVELIDSTPQVTLSNPSLTLHGSILKSRDGREYFGFHGIRYAKPPKRFQVADPFDSESLNGTTVYDATNLASACPRWSNFYKKFLGDEDCLFLNVYVPKIGGEDALNLPVMFYIHGGAFSDGESDSMGADYLMDENVILVTINYRLGALGFLSTGDFVVPGNIGLHDQTLAIKWAHQNIERFGGDKSRLVIFGESAGAASVGLQLLHPYNNGFISGAISQSGTVHCPWAIVDRSVARKNLYELSKLLNCGDQRHSTEYIVKCLKKVSAEDIVLSQKKISKLFPGTGIAFGPVVEREIKGHQAFLTKRPEYLLKNGQFVNVPYIIGVNQDEGHLIYATTILKNKTLIQQLNSDWNHVGQDHIYVKLKDKSKREEVAAKIRQFYFGDREIGTDVAQELVDLHSDVFFTYGAAKTAQVVAENNGKVFTYEFTFYGGFTIMSWHDLPDMKVVTHADELQYLFNKAKYGPPQGFPKGSPADQVSRNLVRLWASFAKSGSPVETYGNEKVWPPTTKTGELKWYQLDTDTKLLPSLHKDRLAFWEDLRQNYYIDLSGTDNNKYPSKMEL